MTRLITEEPCRRGKARTEKAVVSMGGCLISTVVLQRHERPDQVNRLPASPHCGEFEEIIMVARDGRRCFVGNTESMK